MRPGTASVCPGQVRHRRVMPVEHEFTDRVSYVWVDPEAPEDLTRHHPLWSHRHMAPVRWMAADYGDGSTLDLATQVRDAVEAACGVRPGAVRMLTQLRRWGWLFNPLTVYVAWNLGDGEVPAAIVLDVTNTPWKERHRYVAVLDRRPGAAEVYVATVVKRLHVSPFLDEDFEYRVRLTEAPPGRIAVAIDVVGPSGTTVLATELSVTRTAASRRSLGRALWNAPLSTHRVSLGIHRQALRLWRRGVPFVAHPSKRAHT